MLARSHLRDDVAVSNEVDPRGEADEVSVGVAYASPRSLSFGMVSALDVLTRLARRDRFVVREQPKSGRRRSCEYAVA